MVASCTGQGKHNNRSTRRGGSDSGSDFLTTKFSPLPQESDSTDVQNGDILVTSGLDGIFPRGLPVARVVHIERDTAYSFARIHCAPVAGVETFGEIMVLDRLEATPIPDAAKAPAAIGKPASKSGGKRRLTKD